MGQEIIWEHNFTCELDLVTNYCVLVLGGPGCFLSSPNSRWHAAEDISPTACPVLGKLGAGSLVVSWAAGMGVGLNHCTSGK